MRPGFTSILAPALALAVLACSSDDGATTASSTSTSDSDTGTTTAGTTTASTASTASTTASSTTASGGTDSNSDSDATTAQETETATTATTATDATTDVTTTDVTATDATTDATTDTTTDGVTTGTTGEDCVPLPEEICDNGVDDDCDGMTDEKLDYDICGNGVDDDCDGEIDEKLADEICDNGVDDDCNGKVDDGIYCTDSDEDGIPDADDPFPNDKNLPGKAEGNKVYAHTASALFTMDVNAPYDIVSVGNFTYNQNPGQVTDIALDRWGVLYAITFNHLFVCNPATAQCYFLASIPQTANGLTFIPPGLLDPKDDTMVAIALSGAWYKVTQVGNQASFTQIGQYGAGYSSAGDVFSISGVGTYGATNKSGVNNGNVIVEANPMTGAVVKDIGTTTGYTTIYGLAGWEGKIFAFNSNGSVILVNPGDGSFQVVKNTPHSWWGAGVYSVLPQ